MGSPAVATVAAVLAAVNPFFVLGVTDVRTEPLFMFLLTLAIWGLLGAVRSGRASSALLAGAAFALASLTRPAGLAALVLGLAALVLRPGIGRRRLAPALAFVTGAGVFLAPWIVRNAIRYHELIVVNDAAGYSFWRGSHPEMYRIARIEDPLEYRRAAAAFEGGVTPTVAAAILAHARSPNERSRAWFAEGLQNICGNPGDSASFAARRAWDYWRPWLNSQEHGRTAVLGSAAFNLSLFSLAAVGFGRFRPRNEFVFAWIAVYFVAMWLAHIPHQVVMRFRIPFTDPLLVVFAASAIVSLAAAGAGADQRRRRTPPT
jgi:4-amino-4-deoxy-L-arabinose transferase-like glycosyltransferase